jgi:hypothetical protein
MNTMVERRWIGTLRDFSPALIVFVASMLFFFFTGKLTQSHLQEVVIRSCVRFVRFTLFLCIPIFVALPVYFYIITRAKGAFIRIAGNYPPPVHPFTHWLARPFQGIGIIFLLSTKLLISLRIIVGVPETSLILGKGSFDAGRFFTVSAEAALIAFFLSLLWLFDDTGIRYFNKRDKEIKMIGKYLGTLMPILFGFYGIITLRANYPPSEVLVLLLKIVIVLYPPFLIFSVAHRYIIARRSKDFSTIPGLKTHPLFDKD